MSAYFEGRFLATFVLGNVAHAVKECLIKGYPDGTFRPNNRVSTAEFVTVLARSYGVGHLIASEGDFNTNVSRFMNNQNYPYHNQPKAIVNRSQVADIIAKSNGVNLSGDMAIKFLLVNGLSSGKVAGGLPTVENYKGSDALTRAEAVTFIRNLKQKGLTGKVEDIKHLVTNPSQIEEKYKEFDKTPIAFKSGSVTDIEDLSNKTVLKQFYDIHKADLTPRFTSYTQFEARALEAHTVVSKIKVEAEQTNKRVKIVIPQYDENNYKVVVGSGNAMSKAGTHYADFSFVRDGVLLSISVTDNRNSARYYTALVYSKDNVNFNVAYGITQMSEILTELKK